MSATVSSATIAAAAAAAAAAATATEWTNYVSVRYTCCNRLFSHRQRNVTEIGVMAKLCSCSWITRNVCIVAACTGEHFAQRIQLRVKRIDDDKAYPFVPADDISLLDLAGWDMYRATFDSSRRLGFMEDNATAGTRVYHVDNPPQYRMHKLLLGAVTDIDTDNEIVISPDNLRRELGPGEFNLNICSLRVMSTGAWPMVVTADIRHQRLSSPHRYALVLRLSDVNNIDINTELRRLVALRGATRREVNVMYANVVRNRMTAEMRPKWSMYRRSHAVALENHRVRLNNLLKRVIEHRRAAMAATVNGHHQIDNGVSSSSPNSQQSTTLRGMTTTNDEWTYISELVATVEMMDAAAAATSTRDNETAAVAAATTTTTQENTGTTAAAVAAAATAVATASRQHQRRRRSFATTIDGQNGFHGLIVDIIDASIADIVQRHHVMLALRLYRTRWSYFWLRECLVDELTVRVFCTQVDYCSHLLNLETVEPDMMFGEPYAVILSHIVD